MIPPPPPPPRPRLDRGQPEAFVEQISAHRWRAYVTWGLTRVEGEYGTYAWSQKRAERKARKLLAHTEKWAARLAVPPVRVEEK